MWADGQTEESTANPTAAGSATSCFVLNEADYFEPLKSISWKQMEEEPQMSLNWEFYFYFLQMTSLEL